MYAPTYYYVYYAKWFDHQQSIYVMFDNVTTIMFENMMKCLNLKLGIKAHGFRATQCSQ